MKCIDLNEDWLFTRIQSGEQSLVTLPHDAMINTERNPTQRNYFLLAGFEGGRFRYEKELTLTEGTTHILELEACYCMTQVFVNGQLAADHPYGFTPIQVPLDPYLDKEGRAKICIEANVPKEGHGRWYTGAGLTRPVHLYVGEESFISLYGLKVTTLSYDPALIRVDLACQGGDRARFTLKREGKTVLEATEKVSGGRASLTLSVPEATLWNEDHPDLYEIEAELFFADAVCDRVSETFGICLIECRPGEGLFLNGERIFLRGGCIHNDNGVIGCVGNDATELHRAKILKKSGFNALRSAHHPMSRSLLRACDQLGLYVMDEAFDYWYRPKGGNPHTQRFLETFEADTALMVQDAYNHPCVLLYSIGNEIPEAGSKKGVAIGRRILDAIHALDTTRPTTLCPSVHWLREYLEGTPYLEVDEDEWISQSEENKKADWQHYQKIFMGAVLNLPDNEKGLTYPPTYQRADEEATKNLYPYLDIAGYNYYEDRYEELHALHPERLLLGTETRGTMICDTMRFARSHPYLIGDFIWTLQEHLGEANCCGIHYDSEEEKKERLAGRNPEKDYPWLINYGGTIDITGLILPSIHRYEFAWEPEKHGLYLASQPPIHDGLAPIASSYRWTDTVEGWTYEGYEGKPTFVDAYTDAAEVALFLNGKEAGRAPVQDYFAKIPCTYEPGELVGVGYDKDGRELTRTIVRTAKKKTKISAHPDKTSLLADGQDFCFIDLALTDEEGTIKLLPERRVCIKAEGPVTIQGFGSAYHKNEEKYNQESHLTYLGRLQAVIRSTRRSGTARITFSSEGLPETVVELTLV